MAINWEKEYGTNNSPKKSKINWEKEYNPGKYQQGIDIQREERIKQGLPVAVNKEKVAPTKVGNFIRSAIMPIADIGANLINAGRVITGKEDKETFKTKYLGDIKGLGKIDITKSPLDKENLKTLKKSTATGLELGSYATGGGAVVGAGKNVVKQTAKEFLKTSGKQLAKEGAITSGLGSIGYQAREGKVDPLQVLRDTAIGAVASPLLGAGVNKLFGKKATQAVNNTVDNKTSKLLPQNIETKVANDIHNQTTGGRVTEESLNYLKKNPIGVDELPTNKDGTITLYRNGSIESGKPQSYSLKQSEGQVPVNVPKENVLVNYNSSKIDDLYNKSFTKEQIDAGYLNQRKLNKLESEVYAVSPETKITKETPIKEQTTIKQELIEPNIISKDIQKMSENIEGFDEGTFKQWSSDIRNLDKDEITRVALGGKKTVENTIPKNAYLSVAKNIANETGDLDLAQRLATSNVKSKSGQELVASKLATTDNIVDDLIEIKKTRMKNKGITDEVFEKESSDLMNKLKSKINEVRNTKPTTGEIMNIINDLICR